MEVLSSVSSVRMAVRNTGPSEMVKKREVIFVHVYFSGERTDSFHQILKGRWLKKQKGY